MSIKVTCEIPEHSNKPSVRVHSHWSDKDKIEFEVFGQGGEPHRYSLVAKDLIEAVKNCVNVNGRW